MECKEKQCLIACSVMSFLTDPLDLQ